MYDQVREMCTDDTFEVCDRELTSEAIDHICELISGYMPTKEDPLAFGNALYA